VGAGEGMSRGLVSDGCRERYVSIGKARRVLGYVPRVGLEEGIRRSCEVSVFVYGRVWECANCG
jgi:nucleoside-diphosphate-sugar epimerase